MLLTLQNLTKQANIYLWKLFLVGLRPFQPQPSPPPCILTVVNVGKNIKQNYVSKYLKSTLIQRLKYFHFLTKLEFISKHYLIIVAVPLQSNQENYLKVYNSVVSPPPILNNGYVLCTHTANVTQSQFNGNTVKKNCPSTSFGDARQ